MSLPFVAATAIVVFAGIASGLAGFEFVMVSVPPMLFLYPPQTAVTVGILLSLLTGWMVLPGRWQEVQLRTVLALLPGALVGIGCGVLLLRLLESDTIKRLASIVVVAFALVMIRGWAPRRVRSPLAPGIAGAASGALGVTTGMNGSPVMLLFFARGYDTHAFRTSLITYFFLVNIVVIAVLVWTGETGWSQIQTALMLLPAAVVGSTIGRSLVPRVPLALFRRIVLVLILLTGLVGLASSLRPLLGGVV